MSSPKALTAGHDPHVVDLEKSIASLVERSELLNEVGEIARMMTSTQDISLVMHDVLTRTRRLTGADMAYISLNRGRETFIRYSVGIRTQGYRDIRMPLGTGVLGRAATGREPVRTINYLEDPRLLHLPDIDKRVRGEGVRSILGMPMTLHGVTHGALLIADRHPVEYSADIKAVLETLALHTAVALEYSTRLDEVEAALDRLNTRHELEAERVIDLQEVLQLESRLLESIMRGDSPESAAETVQQLLGAPVTVLPGTEEPPSHLHEPIQTARHSAQPITVDGVTAACGLGGGEHLATLIVEAELPEGLFPRLQRIATFLGLAVLMERAQKDESVRQDRVLLDTLLGTIPHNPETKRAVEELGISTDRPFRLLSVSIESSDEFEAEHSTVLLQKLRSALVHTDRAVVARHHGHICALIPEEAWVRGIGERCEELVRSKDSQGTHPRITAGVSSTFTEPASAHEAHRNAERARSMLKVLGASGRIAVGEDLGAVGLLSEALANRPDADSPLKHIEPLRAYDRAHGTKLLETAWALAETGSRVSECAERLHVHPNTVRQRMERISTLLGADWREPARFLDIHVALRMWALAHNS